MCRDEEPITAPPATVLPLPEGLFFPVCLLLRIYLEACWSLAFLIASCLYASFWTLYLGGVSSSVSLTGPIDFGVLDLSLPMVSLLGLIGWDDAWGLVTASFS